MKTLRIILFAILAAMTVPLAASATDGDNCAVNRGPQYGSYTVDCIILQDGKVAADDPTSYQYQFETTPDIVQIEISEDDNCSASATVTFTHQSETASDTHTLTPLLLTRGATNFVAFTTEERPLLPYLNVVSATLTGCTNLTVKMHLWYKQ